MIAGNLGADQVTMLAISFGVIASAGAIAMIRTGLFLRTIAGVVMLSASSGSLRAQADEAEVSTPSAEPMPIIPLELGPPLPPLPPLRGRK